MSEKEERYISITQMVAKENIETEKYRVMPRQEAIERMAKALCADDVMREGYYQMAEVALNAILE